MGIKYLRSEGQIMPPFYFGIAYRDYFANYEVYYWMPFNWIIGFFRFLRIKWYLVQRFPEPKGKYSNYIYNYFAKEHIELIERLNTVRDESEKYYNAYQKCLHELYKLKVPIETIDNVWVS